MARFDVDQALASSAAPNPASGRFNVDDALKYGTSSQGIDYRQAGREMPSPLRGAVTAFQGPAFNLLDELTGGVQGAYKFFDTGDIGKAKQAYIQNRDLIRGMEEQQRTEYPLLSTLTGLSASMPVYVAAPQAGLPALGTGAGGNVARAAINAAPLAAMAAAGQSEGTTPLS